MTDAGVLGIGGKTALVTGASRGVGRAVALALAGAGVNVAVNYLSNSSSADEVVASSRSMGVSSEAFRTDVTDAADAASLARNVRDRLGRIDILVNSAHGSIARTSIEDSSWEEHAAHLEGVLKGSLNLARAVLPGMRENGWGRVVSIGNNMVTQPVRGYSAYTSAMAALLGFTRNLAAEAGPWGVTVNMVSTGFVMTERAPHTNEAVRDAIAAATPLGRLARPEDIAGPVLFLCSELGRFVTGADISVDGGKVMG